MATVAPTTPIIMTTATLTTTPATTGTPAPRYRAALILPIAHNVTIPTTRRPGRISAMMVCGILVHKRKKRAPQAALFLCSTLSSTIGLRLNSSESGAGGDLWAVVASTFLAAHVVLGRCGVFGAD